ncbi:MAG: glycosyltransferase involved in cell wall biosynthesis, partial [Myxococcota bacterium]
SSTRGWLRDGERRIAERGPAGHARPGTAAALRVLIATDRLSLRGGADQHLLDVIVALRDQGVAVTVACGRTEPDAIPEGVAVHRVRALARMVANTRQLDRLTPLLVDADVVHVQNVMNPTALSRLTASGRAVVTIQDHRVFCPGPGKTLPDDAPCKQLMSEATCATCLPEPGYRAQLLALTEARRAALLGARLVVLSDYMAAELAAVGLPGAAVIPPWVDLPTGPPQSGDGFLMGGRLVAHKGIQRALKAWQEADTAMPLHVAGAGPLSETLAGSTALSWLSRAALLEVMAASRALLFPSRWQEPFGILGLQALSVGTPVILFPSGGTRDWSAAGCVLVGSVPEMSEAITALSADPARAAALGRAGQAAVLSRFSRAALLPELLAVYSSVAAKHRIV